MSDRDCWATPPEIFEPLHARYGFTVDVCATADNAKLPRFITPKMDGLISSWGNDGDVAWCNPPYSRENVPAFLGKANKEYELRKVKSVFLLNYCLDTQYIRPYLDICRFVLINPRIEFIAPANIGQSKNNRGQILFLFGIDETARYWDWKANIWDGERQAELFEEAI